MILIGSANLMFLPDRQKSCMLLLEFDGATQCVYSRSETYANRDICVKLSETVQPLYINVSLSLETNISEHKC